MSNADYKQKFPTLHARLRAVGSYINGDDEVQKGQLEHFHRDCLMPAVYEVLGSTSRPLKALDKCTDAKWRRVWELALENEKSPPVVVKTQLAFVREEMIQTQIAGGKTREKAELAVARMAGDFDRYSGEPGDYSLPRGRKRREDNESAPRR